MSLRLRLLLLIGVALSLLWGGVAVWMQHDVEWQMRRALDQRLEMSAKMVAGLMAQHPEAWADVARKSRTVALGTSSHMNELVCQVSSLRGEIYARTPGPAAVSLAPVRTGFGNQTIGRHEWRIYTLEANGLLVTTGDRVAERSTLLQQIMLATLVPFLVALIGGLLVLWLGVGSGLQPLERLRQTLAGRSHDELVPVSTVGMPVDLLPLADTLNELFERIRLTLLRERRFTSDAAHELRTPLTAIKVHLDVMRLTTGAQAAEAFAHVEEGVARLQHTLAQLLTLAQVEGAVSWNGDNAARADEVAYLAARDASLGEPACIRICGDGDNAELAMPQALAVTALRNLLDNARRYAPLLPVELHIETQPQHVCFLVRDSGPGMDDEALARATERFWRRGAGPGSGLGLAIVDAIAARFGGTLALARRAEGGLDVRLTLPRVAQAPALLEGPGAPP